MQPVYKELSTQEYAIHDSHPEENTATDKKEQLYQSHQPVVRNRKSDLSFFNLESYEYKEIAAVIGISESNVGVKINRIKKQLIKQLNNGRQ